MAIATNMMVFTASGTWHKPPRCRAIELILRAGGGGGSSGIFHPETTKRLPGMGGGGGAAVVTRRINAFELPDDVPVAVGVGGAGGRSPSSGSLTFGGNGGESSFGDFAIVAAGRGGGDGYVFAAAAGGLSFLRGGHGGVNGSPGESVTSGVVLLMAGGGGGGSGAGYVNGNPLPSQGDGGWSGQVPPGVSLPSYWQACQSGGGGRGGGYGALAQPGGFPAGGGGGGDGGGQAGANGAAGCVTVIEYIEGEISE
ncbi:glycine-rich domain-containing protein [Prescottella equi]|uniref:glycine-rich domain-containing protein n=1 Tax=Rhodococcus hoagii TaxID=43767 RepID=UPI0007CD7661|nr:hypothetical protein [Prescottella equi]